MMSYKNERAQNYNSVCFLARLHVLKKVLPEYSDVLEIAGGNGLVTRYLRMLNNNVTAIDYNEGAVSNLKKIDKVVALHADIYKFKTAKKFDYILALEVLEHLPDDKKALEKLKNMLKPEGKLIISVPIYKFKKEHRKNIGHLRHYTTKKMLSLAKEVGLSSVYTKEWGSYIRHVILSYLQGSKVNKSPKYLPQLAHRLINSLILLDLFICNRKDELLLILKKDED